MTAQSHPSSIPPLARLPLVRALAENWWLLLLRGVASIIFGLLAFIWPGLTLVALIFLWGAYAIIDGGIALWAAISGRGAEIAPRVAAARRRSWHATTPYGSTPSGFSWPIRIPIIFRS